MEYHHDIFKSTTSQPGDEVEAEVASSHQLADGLYPHQVEGLAFLLGRRRAFWQTTCLEKPPKHLGQQEATQGPWLGCPSVKKLGPRNSRSRGEQVTVLVRSVPSSRRMGGHQLQHFDQTLDGFEKLPWAGLIFDSALSQEPHQSTK